MKIRNPPAGEIFYHLTEEATMQAIKTIITAANPLLFMLFCIFAQPAFAENDGDKNVPNSATKLNLSGLYLGFFPCSDCQGVRTTLALNSNNSYVLTFINVGKSDREFVEKGKFAVSENTLTLTPKKGSTTEQKYLIDGDNLIKLDEDGSRITKDGADGYILHRKDVVNTDGSGHSGH